MQEEVFFQCPHCYQRVSVMVDLSIDEQTYIEDCEVCCRPIQIAYRLENGEIIEFTADAV